MPEQEGNKRCDTAEDGSLSITSIGSTKDITMIKEDKASGDKEVRGRDGEAIVSGISSTTSAKCLVTDHADKSKSLKGVERSDQKEFGLKVDCTTLSESTSDTHEPTQILTDNCKYSIVKNAENRSEKGEKIDILDSEHPKEKYLKTSNATPLEDTTIEENSPRSAAQVSSDGDGKGIVGAISLIRPNECLEDIDDGPVAKRQRICPVDQKDGDESSNKKELSATSEAKLQ